MSASSSSSPSEPTAPRDAGPRASAASAGVIPGRTALRSVAAHARLWGIVAAGLVLDLWSKAWAFDTLRQGGHRPLIPYLLELHTTLNPGALFGIGAGHTEVFLLASLLALALVLWMFAQSPASGWLTHVALGAILAGALGNMYDRAFVSLVEHPTRTPTAIVPRYYVAQTSPDGQTLLLHEYPPTGNHPDHVLSLSEAGPARRPRGYVRDFIKIPTTLPQWNWISPKWRGRELWPWVFNVADMLLVFGVAILSWQLLRQREGTSSKIGRPMPSDA